MGRFMWACIQGLIFRRGRFNASTGEEPKKERHCKIRKQVLLLIVPDCIWNLKLFLYFYYALSVFLASGQISFIGSGTDQAEKKDAQCQQAKVKNMHFNFIQQVSGPAVGN